MITAIERDDNVMLKWAEVSEEWEPEESCLHRGPVSSLDRRIVMNTTHLSLASKKLFKRILANLSTQEHLYSCRNGEQVFTDGTSK